MKRGKGRKASGHLEMILSFILFAFFVLFLILYIKPYKETTLGDSVILGLKDNFQKNNSVNLTKIFVSVDGAGSCFSLNLPYYTGGSIVKRAVSMNKVDSEYNSGVLSVDSGSDSYYIFISPEFVNDVVDCNAIEIPNIRTGSTETNKYISQKYLDLFKQASDNNHDGLKNYLKVPANIDFNIKSDGFDLGNNAPEKTEVLARSYSFNVLNEKGDIVTKDFIFQVW